MIRKLSLFLAALVAATNIACAGEAPATQKSTRQNVRLVERVAEREAEPELTPKSIRIERWVMITTYFESYFRTCLMFAEDGGPAQFKCNVVLLGKLYEIQQDPVLSKILVITKEGREKIEAEQPKRVNRSEQIRTIYPTHTIVCSKDWEDGVQKVDKCGDGEGSMKEAMQKYFAERVPEAAFGLQAKNNK